MGLTFQVVTNTDVGLVRKRNEDAVTSDPERGIVVVADGMGGHPSGDVASRLASQEALAVLATWSSDELASAPPTPGPTTLPRVSGPPEAAEAGHDTVPHLSDSSSGSPASPVDDEGSPSMMGLRMAKAVVMADRKVRAAGEEDPEMDGMGTTVTALLADAELGRFAIGHVGDSRAYRLREGALDQLTRDDSWVQDQVDAGLLSPEGARYHPWSSVLSQALGLDEPANPRVVEGALEEGDVFLVCSDGLCGFVTDPEIQAVLEDTLESGLEATAEALIEAAKDRGAPDNVTVGLLRVTRAG